MVVRRRAPARRRIPRRPRRRVLRRRAVRRTGISTLANASVRPNRLIVKLPYYDAFTFNTAVGVPATQIMNLNSIWDPDRKGVGHSVLGYDQWNKFYNKYRVFACHYDITFTAANDQVGTVQDYGTQCAVLATNGNGALTIGQQFFEQPHCRKVTIGTGMGNGSRTIKGKVYLPYLTGRPAVAYKSDDRYSAAFGQNPVEYMTLVLAAVQNNTAFGTKVAVIVKLLYFVELYDPMPLALSDPTPEQRGPDENPGEDFNQPGYIPTPLS